MTPESPAYHPPLPGDQYCYAMATLSFREVEKIEWLSNSERHYTDATGEEDLGNIDAVDVDGDWIVVEGDWGRVRVRGSLPYFELDN